jgi:hypothetical protein
MIEYVVDSRSRWAALVRGGSILVLPRGADEVVDELWAALTAPDAVAAVLGVLTRGGIADAPPFGLVTESEERRRVVLRGGFRVRVGGEDITAAGVSTWVERVVASDAPFEVLAPFATSDDAAPAWRVVEGVVPAAIVRTPGLTAERAATAERAETAEHVETAEHLEIPEHVEIAEHTLIAEHTAVPDQTLNPVDEATIVVSRPVRPAAAKPAPATGPGAPAEPADGDHDGLTIAVTALQQMRRAAKGGAPAETAAEASIAVAATPPSPVSLRLPGGGEEVLTGEIVLGRSPSVSRASGTRLPRLVTIGTGDPDISRSHVRVGLEGGTIVVTDLHSRNGTTVVQPGRAPVKLRAGEPTPVLAGTVVDLGGGCAFTVVDA